MGIGLALLILASFGYTFIRWYRRGQCQRREWDRGTWGQGRGQGRGWGGRAGDRAGDGGTGQGMGKQGTGGQGGGLRARGCRAWGVVNTEMGTPGAGGLRAKLGAL